MFRNRFAVNEGAQPKSVFGLSDAPMRLPDLHLSDLTEVACHVCGTSVSMISILGQYNNWIKTQAGFKNVQQSAIEGAFFSHTIAQDQVFEVADARDDPRFSQTDPSSNAAPTVFYAGAPIRGPVDLVLGVLCVMSDTPHSLTENQRQILRHLAAVAGQILSSHHQAWTQAMVLSEWETLDDFTTFGVSATDAQGRLTRVNSKWMEIFDLTAKDQLDEGWIGSLHPANALHVTETWTQAVETGSDFDMEYFLLAKNGREKIVRSVQRPVKAADGTILGFVGTDEDVTLVRAQERRLKVLQQRLFSKMGAAAGIGGWDLDLVTQELTWTDEMRRVRGVPTLFKPNRATVLDAYEPESRAKLVAALDAVKTVGTPFALELQMRQMDGKLLWVRSTGWAEMEDGKPIHVFGNVQDISARVNQEQALLAEHQRIILATEGGGVGIWEVDLATKEMKGDRQMFRLFGHFDDPPSRNGNELWHERLDPKDRLINLEKIAKSMADGSRFESEYRIIWPDGSVHYLKSFAEHVSDPKTGAMILLGLTWDVTELRRLSSELAEQGELLRVTLRSIGDAVITTDAEGEVTWLNPIAEKLTGWPVEDARGQPIEAVFKIVHEDTLEPVPNPIKATLESRKNVALTPNAVLVSNSGANYSIVDSTSLILDDSDAIKGAILVFQDVTPQRQMNREMAYRATHDQLTGCSNREEFQVGLIGLSARARTGEGPHSLIYLDLDNFKRINDACGHPAGDQVLTEAVAILVNTVRSLDLIARLGGDEFAIILEYCTVENAAKIGQQICDAMENYRYTFASKQYRLGASIGVVNVNADWPSAESIMQAADAACYLAKEAGGNRLHVWQDSDSVLAQRRDEMGWISRLEQAFDYSLFKLMAQKILPLNSDATGMFAEVLLRIGGPNGTYFMPDQFLPAAERYNMMAEIDRWVLSETVRTLKGLSSLANVNTLSVNMSARSVSDPSFQQYALESLQAAGPNLCHCLAIEITETSAVKNSQIAAQFIADLHNLGVRVWLDDFGAGSASFGHLRTLAVDCLKIDGQFIVEVISDPLSQVTVAAFIEVARVLGIPTVAEYVENQEVMEKLKVLGVDFIQGFLIGTPMPIEAFLQAELPA